MRRLLGIGLVVGLVLGIPAAAPRGPAVGPGVPAAYGQTSLPPVTVCAGPEWIKSNPTSDSVVYRCKRVCPAQDGSLCTYPTTDILGNPLRTIAFVVDSMGGQMRWNSPVSGITAGVFHHSGLNGVKFASDTSGPDVRALWAAFGNEGVRIVEPAWELGVDALGWFARKSGTGTTLPALAVRPAALIQWTRANLVPPDAKLGTVGCSGGSIATFAPVFWHGLGPIVDYQYHTGALPGVWDIPAVCSKAPAAVGICENDPATACAFSSTCSGGSACAIPQPTGVTGSPPNRAAEPVKALIDYIAATGGKCQDGESDPLFVQSSVGLSPGDLSFDHPVDTNVGAGGSPTLLTDTHLGVTYNTGSLYTSIQTTRYKTYSLTPGTHCESISNPAYLGEVLDKIRAGLALSAPTGPAP